MVAVNKWKPGGTLLLAAGDVSGRVVHGSEYADPYGRWSAFTLSTFHTLSVKSLYQCKYNYIFRIEDSVPVVD